MGVILNVVLNVVLKAVLSTIGYFLKKSRAVRLCSIIPAHIHWGVASFSILKEAHQHTWPSGHGAFDQDFYFDLARLLIYAFPLSRDGAGERVYHQVQRPIPQKNHGSFLRLYSCCCRW